MSHDASGNYALSALDTQINNCSLIQCLCNRDQPQMIRYEFFFLIYLVQAVWLSRNLHISQLALYFLYYLWFSQTRSSGDVYYTSHFTLNVFGIWPFLRTWFIYSRINIYKLKIKLQIQLMAYKKDKRTTNLVFVVVYSYLLCINSVLY